LSRRRGDPEKCIKEVRRQVVLFGNKIKELIVVIDKNRVIEVK